MQANHRPQRMCVGCRRTCDKDKLLRLARVADNRVIVDHTGFLGGRGAYLCRSRHCWEHALKRRSLAKALHIEQLHQEDRSLLMQFAQNLE